MTPTRHVIHSSAIAAAERDFLIDAVAPIINRYLTAPLDRPDAAIS